MSFEVYGASSGDNSTSCPHGFSTRRAPGERENGLGSYVGGSAICDRPLFSSVAPRREARGERSGTRCQGLEVRDSELTKRLNLRFVASSLEPLTSSL